jgi:hypothetical protein
MKGKRIMNFMERFTALKKQQQEIQDGLESLIELQDTIWQSEYFKFVKNNFVKVKKNQENIIFLGDKIQVDSSCTLPQLIQNMVEHHFKEATHDIKPLTFIVEDDNIKKIKEGLVQNKIVFNDGYESIIFSPDLFFRKPIVNRKQKNNGKATDSLECISFKIRLLSCSSFQTIEEYKVQPSMVYYLRTSEEKIFNDISCLVIEGLGTEQLKTLFTS